MNRIHVVALATLLLGAAFLLGRPAEAEHGHHHHGRGYITVYNYTDRNLTIAIDGYTQGTVSRGSYESYYCRMGYRVVSASWDTGSTKKYCNVDPYWGYDYCYFYQRDIY